VTAANPLERAFELARSGEYRDLRDLERKLRREGFADIEQHLSGQTIRRQLRDMMTKKSQPTED
jgi:hypothetical protein